MALAAISVTDTFSILFMRPAELLPYISWDGQRIASLYSIGLERICQWKTGAVFHKEGKKRRLTIPVELL